MSAITMPVIPSEQRTEHPCVLLLDGVPTVRGSRIPVRLIAKLYHAGDTVNDIVRSYPHFNAAAVHDALSYYLDHSAEIEREIAAHRLDHVLAYMGAQA